MSMSLMGFLAATALAVSARAAVDVPRFSDDEIAIYREFLLHYPGPLSEMIGMQDTTVPFVASKAFGDEPGRPHLKLEIPRYSGRTLPPEIMALTEETAVAARAASEGERVYPEMGHRLKLSEIAFDSKHQQAVFIYSSLRGKRGTSGAVVYELKGSEWRRKDPVWNFRIAWTLRRRAADSGQSPGAPVGGRESSA